MGPKILVIDDNETSRNLLKSRLERENFAVVVGTGWEDAKRELSFKGAVGVLVADSKISAPNGASLLTWTLTEHPTVRTIAITARGAKAEGIKALRDGVADYFEKPFDLDEMCHAIRRSLREHSLEKANQDLSSNSQGGTSQSSSSSSDPDALPSWHSSSSNSMSKVNETMSYLRRQSMKGDIEENAILILGEKGAGKEALGRMIHSMSRRGKGTWLSINCSKLSEQALKSDLFGHEVGAFEGAQNLKRGVFETVRGGTLFIDEIHEMPLSVQAKLLAVIEEKTFHRMGGGETIESDLRVVVATHTDLDSLAKRGRFDEALLKRLIKTKLEIPPLRSRVSDILPLANLFAKRAFRVRNKEFTGFSPEAASSLEAHRWPGNVSELLTVVERTAHNWSSAGLVGTSALAFISDAHDTSRGGSARLELVVSPASSSLSAELGSEGFMALKKKWSDTFEREYLIAILARHGGNVSSAAREAKLDRSNFLRLLRRHRLQAKLYRKLITKVAA